MKILFLGNFEAEYSSENYYLKTLRKMGHEVFPMQEGKCNADALLQILERENCELFFWVHTHGWLTPQIKTFLAFCRARGVITFAYHLDLFLGIRREIQLDTDPFFEVDHFFTVDKLMAEYLSDKGKCKGHFLPAGVFEDECFLGTPDRQKYPHDIIFTGSKGYHPEYSYRPRLIDWLHDTYGDRFGHYGGGGLPTVRGPELNNLYASAKIVVGDTLCKNFNYPWYSSDRLFEVAGRGGFLIYPKIHGLETMYAPADEVVYYDLGNIVSLRQHIDYYLLFPEIRKMAIERAMIRTKSEHTYTHRMQTILKTLKPELA